MTAERERPEVVWDQALDQTIKTIDPTTKNRNLELRDGQ